MKYLIFSIFTSLLLVSCDFLPKEDTTYGKNRIGIDATLQPALEPAFFMFHETYRNAELTPWYKPEVELIKDLVNDSLKLLILGRKLDTMEQRYVNGKDITPRYTPIARDALAIILNKNNRDKLLSYENVMGVFNGTIQKWSQISANNPLGDVQLIFDSPNSSTATYFMRTLGINRLPMKAAAAKSVDDVIDKVSKIPNAIGVVGLAWVGNMTDKDLNEVNKKVNIAYIRPKGSTKDEYYSPDQMNIYDSLYPFSRTIYIVECTGTTTLGTGLASFIYAEQGQRLMLKTGILPYWVPPRTINIK